MFRDGGMDGCAVAQDAVGERRDQALAGLRDPSVQVARGPRSDRRLEPVDQTSSLDQHRHAPFDSGYSHRVGFAEVM